MSATVEAAWIAFGGVLVGVGGTVIVGVSGFRSTRRATERTVLAGQEDRLWHRKADAYQDALSAALYRKSRREQLLMTAASESYSDMTPEEWARVAVEAMGGQTAPEWLALQGRLGTFGSPQVITAYKLAFDTSALALLRYREWTRAMAEAEPQLRDAGRPEDAEAVFQATAAEFRSFVAAMRQADSFDSALEAAVRADLHDDQRPARVRAWTRRSR
jgi:hypothetical protein